jgi:hypothetical protein
MNKDNKTECWETTLPLNNDKEKDNHPDWKGTIAFDGVIYEAAAWVRTIRNGVDTGKPYISLELKNEQTVVNVKLWPKADQPPFEGREEALGRLLVFAAWPVPLGADRHELKLEIADAPSLSQEALKVQRQVAAYLKTAALSLAASKVSKPVNATVPVSELPSKKEGDSDLGAEADVIPF